MNGTVLLYVVIFISTTILARKSQVVCRDRVYCKKYLLVLSFLVHWFFLVFTNIGADYYNYYRIIRNVTFEKVFSSSEIGFNLLCYILKILCGSPDFAIAIIKTITLLLFYYGFRKIYTEVDIGYVMLTFNLFLYLQGFFIFGMQLSIAFLFISTIQLWNKRNIRAFIFLIIASTFHSTGLLFVPIYVLFYLVNMREKKIRPFFVGVISIIYIIIYCFVGVLLDWAINNIPQFGQYKIYSAISDYSGLGLMQIVFFIPLLYYMYLIYRNHRNNTYKNMTLIFIATAFLFAMLGYKIEVVSRINKSFFMIYAFLVPAFLWDRKHSKVQSDLLCANRFIFSLKSDEIIWTVYIVLRGIDIFMDFGVEDAHSMLNPYIFFWPF